MLGSVRFLSAAGLALGLSSCLVPLQDPLYTGTESGGTTAISTVSTVDADLYLKFETALRSTPDTFTTRVLCQVNVGGTSPQSCTIRVSEAALFLSNGKMTYGTRNKNLCKSILFKPFWYLGENNDLHYRPAWDPAVSSDGVDCAAGGNSSPINPECYNGAAKEMVGGFPLVSAVRFLTNVGVEGRSTYTSPWQKGQYGDNSWVTNNYATPAVAIGGRYTGTVTRASGATYIPFQNWSVACMDDEDEEILQINLTISDLDTVAGTPTPINDYFDWEADGL